MATHLVQHEVSGVVVELTDDQLASPLGALYHPVKTKNGKHYVTKDGKPVLLEDTAVYLDPSTAPVVEEESAEPVVEPNQEEKK